MSWTSILPIILWAVIAVPAFIVLWRKPPKIKLTALLLLLCFFLFNLLCFYLINWVMLNYYLRFVTIVLVFFLLIRFISLLKRKPFLPESTSLTWVGVALIILVLVGLAYANYRVLRSLSHTGDHALAFFPLHSGLYVMGNGGNGNDGLGMNSYMNPFPLAGTTEDPMKAYAVDIFEMGIAGMLGKEGGIIPNNHLDYMIFNETVYSPCVGNIVYVEDGHPDTELNDENTDLGNYIVMQCVDKFFTLGNLRKKSIIVKEGDSVYMNMMVAAVGSSGTPAIPHLLIYATTGGWKAGEGTAVPILFETSFALNNFLYRNKVALR